MKIIRRLISGAASLALAFGMLSAMPAQVDSYAAGAVTSVSAVSASALGTSALFEKCSTTYGYDYLAKCSNGAKRQTLYKMIEDAYAGLWSSTEDISATTFNTTSGSISYYIYDTINYKALGLSITEATETFFTVKNDNPLFYYIPVSMPYESNKGNLFITVNKVYTAYSARKALQAEILDYIDDMTAKVSGRKENEAALMLHDILISKMEYADEAVGADLDKYPAAHNIVGALNGRGVCECYARTYQLLMQYAGYECLTVIGEAVTSAGGSGSDHAWNMIRLGSRYYFVDATWDDHRDTHKYFAKSESTFSSYIPAHFAFTPSGSGVKFLYGLPAASEDDYDLSLIDPLLDLYSYTLNDDGTITITGNSVENVTDLVIPEKIAGFTVSGIGDYAFYGGGFKTVTIPDTVKTIGTGAFEGCTALTDVTLSSALESIGDDAFFMDYNLRNITFPPTLKTIGSGAFFYSFFYTKTVTIPKNVTKIGAYAFGYQSGSSSSYSNDKDYSVLSPKVMTNFTICCDNFSAAENYAVNNGLKRSTIVSHTHSFVYSATVKPTLTSKGYDVYVCECGEKEYRNYVDALEYISGDVNGDEAVNMADLTRLQQYLAQWEVTVDEKAADVNGDGKLTMGDLTRLQQYLADWDVELVYKKSA